MKRRDLLAATSAGILFGIAGCLADGDGGRSDHATETVDVDCEQFEGAFGTLVVGVPVAVPEDATVIDIEETGLLAYDVVEAELEHARETRSEAEDRIRTADDEGEMKETGSVGLGNGARYEAVKASLTEYDSDISHRLGRRWYVTYQNEVYGLSLIETPLPRRLGDAGDVSDPALYVIAISAVNSVPDDAVVIDAHEDGLDDYEPLGELLEIAGCSDEIQGVPRRGGDNFAPIADYPLPRHQYRSIRGMLREYRESTSWYVEYDGAVYKVSLSHGER